MTSVSGGVVAVFAKAAVPGAVKTRLIPQLGPGGAARLHLALVRQALQTALAAGVGRVQLWCTGCDRDLKRLALELEIELLMQRAGNLGERMMHTFSVLLSKAPHVIVVGSDCPSRVAQDFRDAAAQLATACDAVLGPTEDGGYHLIGLRSMQPTVFADIDWSTSAVLEQTRMRLRTAALHWHELPTRWDVDRPADVVRLLADPLYAPLAAELST